MTQINHSDRPTRIIVSERHILELERRIAEVTSMIKLMAKNGHNATETIKLLQILNRSLNQERGNLQKLRDDGL